jgi:hypothetical protein
MEIIEYLFDNYEKTIGLIIAIGIAIMVAKGFKDKE